jgi:hypothetical protein
MVTAMLLAALASQPDIAIPTAGVLAAAAGLWLRAAMPPTDAEVDAALLMGMVM